MKTKKNALIGRVTSSILALTLVAGLVPSAGIAFAAEPGEDQQQSTTTQTEEATESASQEDVSSEQGGEGEETEASTPAPVITNETVKLEGSKNASSANEASSNETSGNTETAEPEATEPKAEEVSTGKTSAYNSSASNITSVQVPLTNVGEKPKAVGSVEYGGVKYTIDAENADTVAVTGISSIKPEGDIQIQSQVAIDGKLYPVTSIKVPSLENIESDNAEVLEALTNPYTNDFFNLEDVAEDVSSITIPSSIESIDLAYFQLFPNLKEISVSEDNKMYSAFGGLLTNKEQSNLLLVPEGLGVTLLGLAQTCWDLQIPCSE